MTQASLRQFSATRLSNVDLGGGTVQENQMYPSGVNNAFRELMGQLYEYNIQEMSYPTAGGTANALTLTPTTALAALASNVVYTFKAASVNTAAATLNVSALGAKAIRKISGGTDIDVIAGDLQVGGRYVVVYDTTANAAAGAWVLVGETGDYMPAINGGPINQSFRNKIINGDFDVWQAGTSFASPASGAYDADMWLITFDGTGATRTLSQQTHTLGQTAVPGNPRYFRRFVQSVAGSGGTFNNATIKMEGVRTLAGKTVTLTCYGEFASANTLPSILYSQNFGSGGSPSGVVQAVIASNIAIGTSFQKIQYTFALPSISGKTLGTNGDDVLVIFINLPLNTTFTFDISHVSLVEGDATNEVDPFSPRHLQQEIALCQRYFYAVGGDSTFQKFGVGICPSTVQVQAQVALPVKMRAVPTVTYSALADFTVSPAGTAATSIGLDQGATIGYFSVTFNVASGLTLNQIGQVQAANTLNARLYFSARL